MKATDRIIGPARGSVIAAKDALDRAYPAGAYDDAYIAAEEYIEETYRLAPLVGIDASIVITASAHETANWTSPRWVTHRNPAGLGIASDDDPDPATFTGIEAARIHVWALLWACGVRRSVLAIQPIPDSADGFMDLWIRKFDDPNCPTVVTIDDLNTRYTDRNGRPQATWAWDAAYTDKLIAKARAIFPGIPDQGQEQSDMAEIVFGNVERPTIIGMICPKPHEGAGFTRVMPRQIVGACDHITDGDGSLEWYHDFFSTDGQRQYDALTDYGIDKAGRIAMWNDPFGTRSPWASGGSDGLEGDGPLFVRTLGIAAINGRLASIEHVGRSPSKMTDAQMESSAQLKAWHFDRARVPWSTFPLNPNVGCVTHMQHWEFATKPCPGAGIRGQTDALQNRIRALLKQGQEGESQAEIPPPAPVEPDHSTYPEGMDRNIAAERFGTIRLHRPGKRTGGFGFHEGHAVCEAWLERGAKEHAYPEGADWWQFSDAPGITRHVVTFINGWVLWRANAREGWRWM